MATISNVTNNTVYFDPPFTDHERWRSLDQGQLLVFSPRKASLALGERARGRFQDEFTAARMYESHQRLYEGIRRTSR